MKLLLCLLLCSCATGCEVYDGMRIANNPNNYDHQWDHDPCHKPRYDSQGNGALPGDKVERALVHWINHEHY